MLQHGEHNATHNKEGLLQVSELPILPLADSSLLGLGLVVVPDLTLRQVEIHFLHLHRAEQGRWPDYFRREEHTITNHELSVHLVDTLVVREFVPHGAHEWLSSPGHSFKSSVDVVDEVVSLVDRRTNSFLYTLRLEPGLSVREVNVGVCAEERVEGACLVELNVEFFSGFTIEAWYVGSPEGVTTDR